MAFNYVTTEFNKSSTDVYLDDIFTVIFDSDVDPTTVTFDTIYLYRIPDYTRFNHIATVNGTNIEIKADPILLADTNYELVIVGGANGVKNTSGDTLANNVVIQFSTKNTLKPVQTEPPDQVVKDYNDIQGLAGENNKILVPDISTQGDIVPLQPCPPGGFSSSSTDVEVDPSTGSTVTVVSKLLVETSLPKAWEIGVTDITNISVVWSENIVHNKPIVIELSYQNLVVPMNPFEKIPVNPVGNSVAIGSVSSQAFDPLDTTNKEFAIVVPLGAVSSVDGSKSNLREIIYFTGPLEPMLCTFDIARANAGMWDDEFSDRDIYYYTKLIHYESIAAIASAGFNNISEVPENLLVQLSKYVCCVTALNMLTYGSELTGSGSGIGSSSLFVKRRTLPGISIEYAMSSGASDTTSDPGTQAMKRLLECINNNKPKNERNIEQGPIVIDHGVKSRNDRSFPRRRRV